MIIFSLRLFYLECKSFVLTCCDEFLILCNAFLAVCFAKSRALIVSWNKSWLLICHCIQLVWEKNSFAKRQRVHMTFRTPYHHLIACPPRLSHISPPYRWSPFCCTSSLVETGKKAVDEWTSWFTTKFRVFAWSCQTNISPDITELQLRKPQKRIHAVVSQKLADSSSAVGFWSIGPRLILHFHQ